MICTIVISCLPSGLAKNNKIMSMFVLFSRFLAILQVWLFSKMGDKSYTKAVKQDISVNFFKFSNNFSKKRDCFD